MMTKTFQYVFVLFIPLMIDGQHVWPQPKSITLYDQYLQINSFNFSIIPNKRCDIVDSAIKRYRERMFIQDCSKLDSRSRGKFWNGFTRRSIDGNYVGQLQRLLISIRGQCESYPYMDMDESYEIFIRTGGQAEMMATSVWGILRALDTFSQLVSNVGRNQFQINVGMIRDSPRFSYRGLMIDTSRHFLSVRSILNNLDAMEINKMNVLHWHVVDDQSFPFVSKTYPELSAKGSYNPKTHIYRSEDVERIVEYARVRGIRVLPEFDTPGHAESWGKGRPGLTAQCYDRETNRPNGRYGPIDPTRKSTYEFLRKFFTEIADRFPDRFLHLGGDEVDTGCWESNPRIRDFMKRNMISVGKLQSFYVQQLVNIVKSLKRSYIVWQDVFESDVELKADTVVHVWIERRNGGWRNKTAIVTRAGYKAILSAPWYLEEVVTEGWRKYYETDPLDFNAEPSAKELVLGGEACMWGEYVDGSNLITKIWPTTNALAEKLWSPAKMTRSSGLAEVRFNRQQCRMQVLGIRAGPLGNGAGFCPCDHVA